MQELVGRLTALDPEASESLKVIAYFDALVDGHASVEVQLRGAAVLSGCAAGLTKDDTTVAVDLDGRRVATPIAPDAERWPGHAVPGGGRVWLERSGSSHANDDMILERLAIALGITFERTAPQAAIRKAVETVIDPAEPVDQRRAAAMRLRLDPQARYAVVAEPASSPSPAGHHTTVVTQVGAVRALIRPDGDDVLGPRAGVGFALSADALDRSWASALIALRLTSDAQPVLRADELGSLVLLAEAADAHDSPDLEALRRAAETPRTLEVLETIVTTDSLRAAALAAGLHHSTMQARAAELSTAFGYDLRTPAGRTRLSLALSLHRLATNRF